MRKRILKLLSTVLAIIIILGVLPLSTFAAEVDSGLALEESIKDAAAKSEERAEIIAEVKSRRDEFTKVFRKNDGTYTAIISSSPIHYKKDGQWEDIDNTLTQKSKGGKTYFENKSNSFKVNLPDEMSKGEAVTMEKDGKKLSFILELPNQTNNGKALGKLKQLEKAKKSRLDAASLVEFESKNQKISYDGAGENTNVEYTVTPTGLKENIVLMKKPKASESYVYTIETNGLSAEKNSDGSVRFFDADGDVFFIPAPVMYDAKGVSSYDIETELSSENGSYRLSYTPSYTWLKNTAKYPVVIDPVVETAKDTEGIDDTMTNSSKPSTNFGSQNTMLVGTNSSGTYRSYIGIGFIYFVAPSAVVKSVKMGLKCRSSNSLTLVARRISTSWKEVNSSGNTDGLTFNNSPTVETPILDYVKVSSADAGKYVVFDITKAFLKTETEDRYGVEISTYNQGALGSDATPDNGICTFSTSEYGETNPSHAPYFEIEYYESNGISDTYDYHTADAGRAGKVYVNDFTGQLYIERDELGIDGNVMPVHIKRYYSELGINSLTNFISIAFSAYGPGWTMNYCRWLEYNNLMGDGRETILYLNEKGNAVYFEKTDEIKDGKRKWREMHFEYIGDTGCTLWMPTSVESAVADNYDKITIEESNGQILKFNSTGALKEIVSAKNSSDKITITHTGRGYDIDTITDGVGRKYVFSYYNDGDITSPTVLTLIQAFNADGTPVKVKDADGNDVDYKITYNGTDKPTSREFISATYPDGKTVSYSTNGDTKYIRNINKYTITYEPLSDGTIRLSETGYSYSSDPQYILGDYIDISRVNGDVYSKRFTDRYGAFETRCYDRFGRTQSVTDSNSNVVYSVFSSVNYGTVDSPDMHNLCVNTKSRKANAEDEENLLTDPAFEYRDTYWNFTGRWAVNVHYCPGNEYVDDMFLFFGGDCLTATTQSITLQDPKIGDVYAFGSWAKAICVYPQRDERDFSVTLSGKVDGGAWEIIKKLPYNEFSNEWQYLENEVTLEKAYSQLMITLSYSYQIAQTAGSSSGSFCFFYKPKIEKISAGADDADVGETPAAPSQRTCVCENCEEYSCPCTCTDEASCSCASCKRKTTTEYDSHGNITEQTRTDGTLKMTQTNTYSANGDVLTRIKDENGFVANYSYAKSGGSMSPEGVSLGNQSLNYTYNAMGEIQKLSQNVSNLYTGSSMDVNYKYVTADKLTAVKHNGFETNFSYDKWGSLTQINIGGFLFMSYTYGTGKFKRRIEKITYANGQEVFYDYDDAGNVSGIKYTGDSDWRFTFDYDEDYSLVSSRDTVNNTVTEYSENGYTVKDASTNVAIYSVSGNSETYNGSTFITSESAGSYNSTTGVSSNSLQIGGVGSQNGVVSVNSEKDWFSRAKSSTVKYNNGTADKATVKSEYTYKAGASMGTTTNLVERYINQIKNGNTSVGSNGFAYTYDAKGNIATVSEVTLTGSTSLLYKYYYDEANQIVRVDDKVQNKTFSYVYNKGGNLHTVKTYNYTSGSLPAIAKKTDSYTYVAVGWVDKLAYVRGKHLTYDDVGNLLTYNGKTHTWGEGRQLATFENGSVSAAYKYDENGLRTQKTVGNKTYSYTWANEKLVGSTDGTNALRFIYGSDSAPVGFTLNNTAVYLYLKNLQGDIVGIVDENGTTVVKYTYDAWGKPTSVTGTMASTIGEINPLRYRGYYYDSESGYYYVQTRYYDPEICRYINAAEGGDAVPQAKAPAKYAHANRFLFNANDPQTCSMVPNTPDVGGTVNAPGSITVIPPGSGKGNNYLHPAFAFFIFLFVVQSYIDNIEIGLTNSGKKGTIAITLDDEKSSDTSFSEAIYEFYGYMGDGVFSVIALFATDEFYKKFHTIFNSYYNGIERGLDMTAQREFLFSDDCVAEEIKEHVIGYWYGTEKSKEMTSITRAMLAFSHGSKTTLIKHCRVIDIGEQDVVGTKNLLKNVMPFHYYNGIRECYLYTKADPYCIDAETREFSTPSLNWALNKISV